MINPPSRKMNCELIPHIIHSSGFYDIVSPVSASFILIMVTSDVSVVRSCLLSGKRFPDRVLRYTAANLDKHSRGVPVDLTGIISVEEEMVDVVCRSLIYRLISYGPPREGG